MHFIFRPLYKIFLLVIQLIRNQEKYFMREFPQLAAGCCNWIEQLIHDRNINIQSAFHGGERKLGSSRVDGLCSEMETVFEFHGDYWHAHPDQFPNQNALHPTVKDKDGNSLTVKDIEINIVCKTCETKATMSKLCGEKIRKLSCTTSRN